MCVLSFALRACGVRRKKDEEWYRFFFFIERLPELHPLAWQERPLLLQAGGGGGLPA
jgi:hypothetical protein